LNWSGENDCIVRNDSPRRGNDLNNSSSGVGSNEAVGDLHANNDFMAIDIWFEGRRWRPRLIAALLATTPGAPAFG